jgi:hypothetical protein
MNNLSSAGNGKYKNFKHAWTKAASSTLMKLLPEIGIKRWL